MFDKGLTIPAVPSQSGWRIPEVIMTGKLGEVRVYRRNTSETNTYVKVMVDAALSQSLVL